ERALAGREPVRLERIAETQIDAVHPQIAAVVVEPLQIAERGEDLAQRALVAAFHHLEADELAAGRQAEDRARVRLGLIGLIVLLPADPDCELAVLVGVLARRFSAFFGIRRADRLVSRARLVGRLLSRARLASDDAGDMAAVAVGIDDRGFPRGVIVRMV